MKNEYSYLILISNLESNYFKLFSNIFKKEKTENEMIENSVNKKEEIPKYLLLLTIYYSIIHLLIGIFGGLILLFSNDITHVTIMTNIVFIDVIVIYFLKNCPIFYIDNKIDKNMAKSTFLLRKNFFESIHVDYECFHYREMIFELLFTLTGIFLFKIIVLLFLKYNKKIKRI